MLIETDDLETADIETGSDGYAQRFQGMLGEYFLEVQARAVLEFLSPWPKARILEVGGGHAQTAGAIIESGRDVTVVGSSEVARMRLDRLLRPGSFHFRSCNLLALPFPDRSFDVAIALRLLPHVRRWKTLMGELCRVAAHAVIIDYPDWRSFNIASLPLFHLKKSIEGNTRPFQCFRGAEISREFARHGYASPDVRREFFLPMALHRALKSASLSRVLESWSGTVGLTSAFGSPVVMRVISHASPTAHQVWVPPEEPRREMGPA